MSLPNRSSVTPLDRSLERKASGVGVRWGGSRTPGGVLRPWVPVLLIGGLLGLAGCAAAETRPGYSQVTLGELREKVERHAPIVLVFACAGESSSRGLIPSAIPVEDFRERMAQLSKDAEIILYCACPGDKAAHGLARELAGDGFTRVSILPGGLFSWIRAGYTLAPAGSPASRLGGSGVGRS